MDFWNYTLSMKEVDQGFMTDWSTLGPELVHAAAGLIAAPSAGAYQYQGLNFYGSYDPASAADKKLYRWATTKVDTFPGVNVSMMPRQKKRSPPRCPACQETVPNCPTCGFDMRGTEEKGVDVRMATDMIKLAWVDNYDVAVLVSSDQDFVPVAEFLETRGIKVIHGAFPPKGAHLTRKCWAHIDVSGLRGVSDGRSSVLGVDGSCALQRGVGQNRRSGTGAVLASRSTPWIDHGAPERYFGYL